MDMPGRIEYTIYWPGMVLSTDEKYLFYQTHRYEQSDICQHSSDGPACSLYGLGVVDLTTSPPTPTELPLPRDCGVAGLHPLGTAAVTVACTGSSRLLVVGNDHLSIADVTPLGGLPSDPRPNRPSTGVANALAGYERSDGSLGLLLSSGDFWVVNAGRVAKQVRAVPEGAHVQSVGQLDARNGVVAIPYRSGSAQTAAGVASFNLETLAVDGLAPSAQGASFVANSGPATRLLIGDLVAEQSAPGGVADLFRGFDAQAGWAIIR